MLVDTFFEIFPATLAGHALLYVNRTGEGTRLTKKRWSRETFFRDVFQRLDKRSADWNYVSMDPNSEPDSWDKEPAPLKELGIKPAFLAEEGPAVDREWLRNYLRGRLEQQEKELVETYVFSFRNWYSVYFDEILREPEFQEPCEENDG